MEGVVIRRRLPPLVPPSDARYLFSNFASVSWHVARE
jgi:hypothetical protein